MEVITTHGRTLRNVKDLSVAPFRWRIEERQSNAHEWKTTARFQYEFDSLLYLQAIKESWA